MAFCKCIISRISFDRQTHLVSHGILRGPQNNLPYQGGIYPFLGNSPLTRGAVREARGVCLKNKSIYNPNPAFTSQRNNGCGLFNLDFNSG